MARKTVALLALPLALALVGAIWGLKIHAELAQGWPVFWLAELWAPAAVFTIVVVVCVDYVTAAPKPRTKAKPGKARPRPARRRE